MGDLPSLEGDLPSLNGDLPSPDFGFLSSCCFASAEDILALSSTAAGALLASWILAGVEGTLVTSGLLLVGLMVTSGCGLLVGLPTLLGLATNLPETRSGLR